MAFESGNSKYSSDIPQLNNYEASTLNYSSYNCRAGQMDENRDINSFNHKKMNQGNAHQSPIKNSTNNQIKKIDASTMTDPLSIDFRRTSEYLARCSNSLGINRVSQYDSTFNSCLSEGIVILHCPECPTKFEDQDTFHAHLEEHRQRPHICDICGASLKRKEHLDRHKQGHNKDRPYKCSLCCKAFKRNEHLARHMIIHSGSKNQICSKCGKAFFRKDHLKKHLQSHISNNKMNIQPQYHNSNNNTNINNNNDNNKNDDANNNEDRGNPNGETLGNIAMMVRQLRTSPFSILRT
ncbi:zinc finger protein 85-like [Chelonus insularis]|uniref:zinc finger protein 85-like n=1 Tax=Chelonus insularis TaxID=460826 RepID=UPI00158D552B|nr:zinc finger protein 85-like [Chelonus insularis]